MHNQFYAAVPEIITHNTALNCFLMKDAGRPLRAILKEKFDIKLLCKAIEQFTFIQSAVADHTNIFLGIGVPDWRVEKLPKMYKELLSQKDLLKEDRLSEIEINKLEALFPIVLNLCKKLSMSSIKQTIVQCDFHDNNILIKDDSQNITIIDLGEIVISHPFFSLTGCLRQIKKHYGLTEKDDAYHKIINSFFKNYMVFESKKYLLNMLTTANTLWFIYEILVQYRLLIACGIEKIMSFQKGKLSNSLKEFMNLY